MQKIRFRILSIKKEILPITFVLFIIALVVFSKNNFQATKNGILLWANNIVPSLLPFFIATELLMSTDIVEGLGKLLKNIMRPIFNVPGAGSFALIMGIIAGYPTGAKIVKKLKENGECSSIEAERLISFTNNSGPLFILGTVGISIFGDSTIGVLLLISHLFACITVGIIFRFWKRNKTEKSKVYGEINKKQKDRVKFSNLGEILRKSILSSIETIFIIGGFVVLSSVILSILNSSKMLEVLSNISFVILRIFKIYNIELATGFTSGIIEITNGIVQIAKIPCKQISINIILTAFLLGFGGFSVLMQVYSITSKAKISIKPYIIGKILHGIIAVIYTYIAIYAIPIFNLNL